MKYEGLAYLYLIQAVSELTNVLAKPYERQSVPVWVLEHIAYVKGFPKEDTK